MWWVQPGARHRAAAHQSESKPAGTRCQRCDASDAPSGLRGGPCTVGSHPCTVAWGAPGGLCLVRGAEGLAVGGGGRRSAWAPLCTARSRSRRTRGGTTTPSTLPPRWSGKGGGGGKEGKGMGSGSAERWGGLTGGPRAGGCCGHPNHPPPSTNPFLTKHRCQPPTSPPPPPFPDIHLLSTHARAVGPGP